MPENQPIIYAALDILKAEMPSWIYNEDILIDYISVEFSQSPTSDAVVLAEHSLRRFRGDIDLQLSGVIKNIHTIRKTLVA